MVIRKFFVVLTLMVMGPLSGCGASPSPAPAGADARELGPELCSQRELIPAAANGQTPDSWNRLWFIALGKRCACWEGELLCIAPDPPHCFTGGRWFHEGQRSDIVQNSVVNKWCFCKESLWQCGGTAVLTSNVVSFLRGETAILDEDRSHLAFLAGWLAETPNRGLALTGLVDLSDGTQAIDLANRRAESVRKVLIEHGLPEDRVLLLPAELDPLQSARLRRVRYERIPKPSQR